MKSNAKSLILAAGCVACLASLAQARPDFPEVEPNESRTTATVVNGMAPGDTITGASTGTSTTAGIGLTSADYFDVKTTSAGPAGFYRYRLVLTSTIAGHTATIRGLNQTAGVVGTTDSTAQTSSTTTTPARYVQWYANQNESRIYYRVTGATTTTANYVATLERTPVAPIVASGTLNPGNILVTSIGQTTVDTDMWLYDSNFTAIAGAGNDDESVAGGGTGATAQSRFSRSLTPGTYYLAVTAYNLCNNQPSPADDDFRTGIVLDFDNALSTSSSTTAQSLNCTISDGNTTIPLVGTKGAYDVVFYQFTVGVPAGPVLANCTATPNPVARGSDLVITASPSAGTSGSPIASVTADLSAFGGSVTAAMLDNGVAPDVTAADGIYTVGVAVPAAQTLGATSVLITAKDGNNATANCSANVTIILPPPTPVACPGSTETEPNDSKPTANALASTVGNSICGTTLGTGTVAGPTSADYFKLTTAQHTGIVRHTAKLATNNTAALTLSLVGVNQTAGVPGTTESTLQTARTSGTDRFVDWYTLGNDSTSDARAVFAKVTGTIDTTANYNLAIDSSTEVVPAEIARSLVAGTVTITTVGTTGTGQTDTDLWVLDSNFNLIPDWGNDDEPTPGATLGSKLTRTFADGTYYLALGVFQMSVNPGSPSDDRFRTGSLTDYPGVIVESVSTLQDRSFRVTDSTGDILTSAAATQPFEILFFKLQVGSTTPTLRCQPADIAYGNGDPLPPFGVAGGFNPGVDGGDFDCFFNFYFEAAPTNAVCDIADGVGDPLPPFGPGTGFNPGVDGGDFDCFFNFYFNGCP